MNKEILQNYNSRLAENNNELDKLIAKIDELPDSGGAGTESEIPSAFVRIEKVVTHKDQYIDTKLIPTANTGFEIDFETRDQFIAAHGALTILGSRSRAYYVSAFQLTTYTTAADGDINGAFAFGTVSSSSNYYLIKRPANMSWGTRIQISFKNRVFTDALGNTSEFTENLAFDDAYSIALFGLNEGGSPREQSNTTLYECKFYEGDTLVRHYIPVMRKIDGMIGLYDTIMGIFYDNDGDGFAIE
jgi:hypothetical protein